MNDSDLAASLEAHLRGARRMVDEHPEPQDLVAYRSGVLNAAEEREVRTHLIECELCCELLLELAELEEKGPENVLSEHELEQAWRQQKNASRIVAPRLRSKRNTSSRRFGWIAAACLGLVVAGLAFEVRELQRDKAALYQDVPRVIAAERSRRSQNKALPMLALESDQPGIVLLLVDGDLPFDSFRAEFFRDGEEPFLTRHGLSVSEDLLLIVVPPNSLPAGSIRVAVSGLREGQHHAVEEYDLRVDYL